MITLNVSCGGTPVRNAWVIWKYEDKPKVYRTSALSDKHGNLKIRARSGEGSIRVLVSCLGYWESDLILQGNPGVYPVSLCRISMTDVPWWHEYLGIGALSADYGEGVRIGVIDSGCADHPQLKHVMVYKPSHEKVNGVTETRFVEYGREDPVGHGTHVTGVLAASVNDRYAFHGAVPGAEVHVCRVFDNAVERDSDFEEGSLFQDKIVEAIDFLCEEVGVDVLNMSFDLLCEVDALPSAVSHALDRAHARGTVCVAAAGNDEKPSICFPASSPKVCAIASYGIKGKYPINFFAHEPTADTGKWCGVHHGIYLAKHSNTGAPGAYAAPGVGICSTYCYSPMKQVSYPDDQWYWSMSGTSMACAVASGLFASWIYDYRTKIRKESACVDNHTIVANARKRFIAKSGFDNRHSIRGVLAHRTLTS